MMEEAFGLLAILGVVFILILLATSGGGEGESYTYRSKRRVTVLTHYPDGLVTKESYPYEGEYYERVRRRRRCTYY